MKLIVMLMLLVGCYPKPDKCRFILLDNKQNLSEVFDKDCSYRPVGATLIYTIENGEAIHKSEDIDIDLFLIMPLLSQTINTLIFVSDSTKRDGTL